jgi:DNA-binding IclR family transcriptional regulator
MKNDLLKRIQGEFLEMPGLRLTPEQAARLLGLERQTCVELLGSLVVEKFLACGPDGRYTRLTEGSVFSS